MTLATDMAPEAATRLLNFTLVPTAVESILLHEYLSLREWMDTLLDVFKQTSINSSYKVAELHIAICSTAKAITLDSTLRPCPYQWHQCERNQPWTQHTSSNIATFIVRSMQCASLKSVKRSASEYNGKMLVLKETWDLITIEL